MDYSNMTDEEVLALRVEVNAEADRRVAAMQLRDRTHDLAREAKELGRTRPEVEELVAAVVADVYDDDDDGDTPEEEPPAEEPRPPLPGGVT